MEDLKADLAKASGSDVDVTAIATLKKEALLKALAEIETKKARQLEDELVAKWNESVSQFVDCFADRADADIRH